MYPEFILIYVGLGILLVLGIILLVLLIVVMSKLNKLGAGKTKYYGGSAPSVKTYSDVAFCKKCATEFDVSERFCPKCGTPR